MTLLNLKYLIRDSETEKRLVFYSESDVLHAYTKSEIAVQPCWISFFPNSIKLGLEISLVTSHFYSKLNRFCGK